MPIIAMASTAAVGGAWWSGEEYMTPDVLVRAPLEADLPDIAALLAAEDFGDDSAARLRAALVHLRTFSLVAVRANHVEGVLLAVFNGWHIFLSHLAVSPTVRGSGIARLLVDTLARNAVEAGAKGVITDARLSAVGFFQKLGFRPPGAVFLITDTAA
jgi:predicted N-acetyltransferase YhbS